MLTEERKSSGIFNSVSAVIQAAKKELFDPAKKHLDFSSLVESMSDHFAAVNTHMYPKLAEELMAIDCCPGTEESKLIRMNVTIDELAAKTSKDPLVAAQQTQATQQLKDFIQQNVPAGIDHNHFPFSSAYQKLKLQLPKVKTNRKQTLGKLRDEVDMLAADTSMDEQQKHAALLQKLTSCLGAIGKTFCGSPGIFNNGSQLYIGLETFLKDQTQKRALANAGDIELRPMIAAS